VNNGGFDFDMPEDVLALRNLGKRLFRRHLTSAPCKY
jgi:hypothetical protein